LEAILSYWERVLLIRSADQMHAPDSSRYASQRRPSANDLAMFGGLSGFPVPVVLLAEFTAIQSSPLPQFNSPCYSLKDHFYWQSETQLNLDIHFTQFRRCGLPKTSHYHLDSIITSASISHPYFQICLFLLPHFHPSSEPTS
jgi:hypothetical protein